MVGMRNETIISMRFVRSKLRKREESSHVENSTEATPTHVVSTVEPVGFRQSPSSVWHFPPLPPQPNLYIYNASSQVSWEQLFFPLKLQTWLEMSRTQKFPFLSTWRIFQENCGQCRCWSLQKSAEVWFVLSGKNERVRERETHRQRVPFKRR